MSKIDSEMVSRAISDFDRSLELDEFREINSGRARTVLDVNLSSGKSLILYLCTNDGTERRFKKEEKLVEKVNEETEIPTQNILHSNFKKDKLSFLFYIANKVDGYDPINRFKYLPSRHRNRIVRESAEYLADLHSKVEFDSGGEILLKDGELEVSPEDWYSYMEDWAEPHIKKMGDNRFSDLQPKAWEFMEKHRDLAELERPKCVHFDVTPDNLIVKNGKIKAVIDWEKAISGPPEWDLAYSKIHMINAHFQTRSIEEKLEKIFFQSYMKKNDLGDKWKEKIVYFNTVYTFKTLGEFERWIDEQDKPEEEKFFRKLFKERYENLERAAENLV